MNLNDPSLEEARQNTNRITDVAAASVKDLILFQARRLKPFPTMKVALPRDRDSDSHSRLYRYSRTKSIRGLMVLCDLFPFNYLKYLVLTPEALLGFTKSRHDMSCENPLPSYAKFDFGEVSPSEYVKYRTATLVAIDRELTRRH